MNCMNDENQPEIIWAPQEGSQELFLSCPVYEVLYEGTRGCQKTDSLLMDFAQDTGQGYGRAWRGIIFRRTYKQLDDLIERAKHWFYRIFPGIRYNEAKYVWTWPDGEQLLFRHMLNISDYENYHGHEYSSYHKCLVEYSNGKKVEARHVKVGDVIQTLDGPHRVLKVFHYKKHAIELSLFDSHSNLIGRQLQGILHPVLTTAGWQRLGLSCLSQISPQSSSWEPLSKEVEKFLLGIHREIIASFYLMLQNPLDGSISRLNQVQFSSLRQILNQLRDTSYRYDAFPGSVLCRGQDNEQVFASEPNTENAFSSSQSNSQNVQQLASLCASSTNLLLWIHQVRARLIQSILSRGFGRCSSRLRLKSLFGPQSFFEIQSNFLQPFLSSLSMQGQIAWNDTFSCAQFLRQEALSSLDNCQHEYDSNDGILLRVLGTDQFSFPSRNDVQEPSRASLRKDVHDTKQTCNHRGNNSNAYTHPYTHEFCQTTVPLKPYCFSVRALPGSPIPMVDFMIEKSNHYITHLMPNNQGQNGSNSIQVVNSNSYIAFEELTNWPDDKCYETMKACCRSSRPNMPRKYRANTNPWGVGRCVPFGEVLTPDGWKDIRDFSVGDEVFTVTEGRWLKKTKVDQMHAEDFEGYLCNVGIRGLSMHCTEDHSVVALPTPKKHPDHIKLYPFSELPGQAYILKCVRYMPEVTLDYFVVPTIKTRKRRIKQPSQIPYKYYAELMGWWLSEGCCVDRDKAFVITQVNIEGQRQIENLLQRCGFKYSKVGKNFTCYAPDWWAYLKQFGKCYAKFIPKPLKESHCLKPLFNALVDGDGHWVIPGRSGHFYSTSLKLIDDFSEIAIKLGFAVSHTSRLRSDRTRRGYCVLFKTLKTNSCQVLTGNHRYNVATKNARNANTQKYWFRGKIYCLGIKDTNTFLLRQNGSVWVSGNSWVKRYFIDPAPPGAIMTNKQGEQRVRIHGTIYENKALMQADPDYVKRLESIKDVNKRKAWLFGDWNVASGGPLEDYWDEATHVVEPFKIPFSWYVDRSFDWGSAKPFSVGWWAQSDGCEVTLTGGTKRTFPRGTLFHIYEMYGWNGNENEGCNKLATKIAEEIKEAEASEDFKKIAGDNIVHIGPADSAIFDEVNGMCIAKDMKRKGVTWAKAKKGPGSRRQGLEKLRRYLDNATKFPMEEPGLFIFSNCRHFIRTVPSLPRSITNVEDVDTNAEDHAYDSCRYRLTAKRYINRQQEKYR